MSYDTYDLSNMGDPTQRGLIQQGGSAVKRYLKSISPQTGLGDIESQASSDILGNVYGNGSGVANQVATQSGVLGSVAKVVAAPASGAKVTIDSAIPENVITPKREKKLNR